MFDSSRTDCSIALRPLVRCDTFAKLVKAGMRLDEVKDGYKVSFFGSSLSMVVVS